MGWECNLVLECLVSMYNVLGLSLKEGGRKGGKERIGDDLMVEVIVL